MSEKLTIEQIRIKTKEMYGDKYEIPDQEYKGVNYKIDLLCKDHGLFKITPYNFLKGGICRKCRYQQQASKFKLGWDKFEDKARMLWGTLITFSKQEYINNRTKITARCHEHGNFKTTPQSILNKKGCPKCNDFKKTWEYFIQKATKILNNRGHIPLQPYFGTKVKIKIVCKKHGDFYMTPNNFLKGQWCPSCNGKKKKTLLEFRIDAKKIHGDVYEIPDQEYINSKTKMRFICKRHGDFWQTPNNHLHDYGCLKCANELNFVGKREKKYFQPFIKDYFKDYTIEFQYPVYKEVNPEKPFLIDVVIKELNLAFEYDEKHHKYQQNQDEFRQKIIIEKTGFKIIRVSDKKFMKEIRNGGTGKIYFESIFSTINTIIV